MKIDQRGGWRGSLPISSIVLSERLESKPANDTPRDGTGEQGRVGGYRVECPYS